MAGKASRQTATGGRDASTGLIPGRYALSVGMPDTAPPPGWSWTPLSAVAKLESGHTPSRRHPEYWDGEIPWIGIRDATDNHGRTLDRTYQTVTQAGIDNSSARVLPAGTVCLSRTASVGYVVVMGRPMATSQDFVNWVCSEKIDSRFLKYLLVSEHDSMLRFASGTTHQTIYYPEAKGFHVCLPPLRDQRAIADVLGALDEKIEVIRRMNETLEALARTLFKSWFVDFDPVRANAEVRASILPESLGDLFPDSFHDSDLGKIPKGWKTAQLGELLNLKRGYDLPSTQRRRGRVPVVSSSGISGTHTEAKVLAPGIVTGRYGTIGRVFFVREDFWPLNTTLYVQDFKGLDAHYAFYLLQRVDFAKYSDKGAVPGINRNQLHEERLVDPPAAIRERFGKSAGVWLDQQSNNARQAATLVQLRDTLLPRLISGKLRATGDDDAVARS